MDDQAAPPPDNISSSPAVLAEEAASSAAPEAAAAAATADDEKRASPHHHHRRSKREKYSPSRFVARPSSPRKKSHSEHDAAAAEIEAKDPMIHENYHPAEATTGAAAVTQRRNDVTETAALKSEEDTTPPLDNNDDDDDDKKPSRRTSRAHAAVSYLEPPDFDISDTNEGGEDDQLDDDDGDIIEKVCNDADNTVLQISTVKQYHPRTKRSLCNVIGCRKADQVGREGYCQRHFRLISAGNKKQEEENDEEMNHEEGEEEGEEEIDQKVKTEQDEEEEEDTKPRLNSTIRILTGDFAGLTGNITNIKQGGWCSLTNPKVTKPIRMSNMEVVQHNGPKPPPRSPVRRIWNSTPVKKREKRKKLDSSSVSRSGRRGRGRSSSDRGVGSSSSGRPVRERKPPQSLLVESSSSSPMMMSTTTPRRSTRGDNSSASSPFGKRDSSIRRSRRGPTPSSPRYDDKEEEDEEEEVVEVRPRGKRGRAPSSSKKKNNTTPSKKDGQLCKTPSCTKHRQGRCEGYCTTCFRDYISRPSKPQSATRICRAGGCTKYNQYNCEGYCMKHFRQFVLDEEEEEVSPPKKRGRRAIKSEVEEEDVEEEEDEVVSPPKKRGRRAIKSEVEEEEEEYVEEEEVVVDDDSPFDDPPRKGGSGTSRRLFCKVKLCDKWSQGAPKNGMCFKHFNIYGFEGGSKKKKKARSTSRSSAVAKLPPPQAAAVAKKSEGEIEVGSLVMVKERMGAGMNKPGGVGRVKKVYSNDEGVMVYDVKYILGGREKGVDANSLWLHDINAKSPMKPPPSFGGEEEDAVMLDEDDESIEDHELEGYDEFSFSQLEVPDQSVLDQRALRREEQLSALGGNNFDDDYDDHNLHLEENWKCAKCGGLNRASATSHCTTCKSHRVEKNASEDALLERTRYELLNGNDFWICTSCAIGVPSLLMPCGRCHSSIPFVPLTMPEFEDFVRGQRKIKRKREEEIKWEWNQKLEEVSEEWEDRKEKESTTAKPKQQQVEWSKLPCKVLGCKEICAPNSEGFCEDHFRTVIMLEEPEAYPIVRPEDKQLISEYFFLTYEQFRPCVLQDWERTRKHKDHKVQRGHPGIACRHCFGREDPSIRSMGRYFPLMESSLYQQTFTSNAVKHLLECPHCPAKVQKKLVSIKEELANVPSDGKKVSSKFVGEKGGRGKFFRRIWCRLHQLPLDEEEAQSPKKMMLKKKS